MTTNPFDADRPPERARGGPRRGGGNAARRRRRDETVMVPDVEFESYYGRGVVKVPPWGHEIPAYLFLGGLAAGSGLVGAGGAARNLPGLRRGGRLAALVAVALGGGALAKDLGRPDRALNMMRTVKLTSPMSVGSWILAGFGAFAGLSVVTEAGRALPDQGSLLARALRVADPPAAVGSALLSAPLAAYTAVLLSDTAAPTWHESYRELPFVFVGSANAAAAGLALVLSPADETAPVRAMAASGAALELGACELLKRRMDPLLAEPLHEGRAGRLLRVSEVLTAAGALGAALFGRHRKAAAVSGLALMAGSALTRFGIFEAGMESARDPRYTVQPQRERLEKRRAAGVTDDSITTAK
ncbi:MAG TPA: NrfD/PsrC family molybdoenzyme membrane anchor subunit [Pedococcus sp.]|jgi:hypothetical protein|uniref:NrfD/PsrC family molybdoenzyme membrane anchor subunit n=1 Tax=Pedococcus sp. TaxID=2860345 RepID=UPI002F958F69